MVVAEVEKAIKALGVKPTLNNFIEGFGVFAQGPSGSEKIRRLILELAVSGRLTTRGSKETLVGSLLESIFQEKKVLSKKGLIKGKIFKEENITDGYFEIPANWKWVKLRGVGYTQTGSTPKKSDGESWGNDIPFIKPGNISEFTEISYSGDSLSKEGAYKLDRLAPGGSVLMVCIGTIGKCASINRECAFNQQINAITPLGGIDAQWLTIVLRAPFFQALSWGKSSSTTISIINKGKWESIYIPLAPIEEQKRIVTKVDELMALCDQLEAQQQQQSNTLLIANTSAINALLSADSSQSTKHKEGKQNPQNKKSLDFRMSGNDKDEFNKAWKRIANKFHTLYGNTLPMPPGEGRQKKHFVGLENVKQLKQLILQLGTTGLLVQSCKCNNASDDLKEMGIKSSIDKSPFRIPHNWVWVSLGDLSQMITSGSRGWKEYYSDNGDIFIRSQDIKFDKLLFNNKAYVSLPKKAEGKRTKVSNGDLLITITGANVGKCALVSDLSEAAYVSQHVALVKLHSIIYSDYLHKWLTNGYGGREMLIGDSYGDKPGLNLKQVSSLAVPFPPIEEQKRIVAKVDQLMALCDQLEQQLITAYTDSKKLNDATIRSLVA